MAGPAVAPIERMMAGRLRWWGAAAGIAVGILDTLGLVWLGASFEMAGRDVTGLVATWFGLSFALLGFLLGDVYEARRRERAADQALATARARVAQSEKLAALGQLAATIAHEVRNPLAVVRSAAQGLTETLPDADAAGRRSASFIIAEVDRLTSVVGSLLAFARPLRVEARLTAVDDVVARAVALAERELTTRTVRLRREQEASLPMIHADGDLVCQVLVGLLSNAAQATRPGGEVTVRAAPAGDAVELVVSDDGPGIAPDLRERVFEPFFTTRADGTGLGLAVARQIVEAHGGRISAGVGPAGGASFTVRLPAKVAA